MFVMLALNPHKPPFNHHTKFLVWWLVFLGPPLKLRGLGGFDKAPLIRGQEV